MRRKSVPEKEPAITNREEYPARDAATLLGRGESDALVVPECATLSGVRRSRASARTNRLSIWYAGTPMEDGKQAGCLSAVAFAVPSALMVPATTAARFTGGPDGPRVVGRNPGTLISAGVRFCGLRN
jgi:hypothetical protein